MHTSNSRRLSIPAQAFGPFGPKADVWGLGCILLHAISGKAPHGGASQQQVHFALVTARQPPALPAGLPEKVERLLSALLRLEPDKRPTSADAARWLESAMAATPVPPPAAPADDSSSSRKKKKKKSVERVTPLLGL